MKLILIFFLGLAAFTGCASSDNSKECEFKFSDAEIIAIAQNELKRLGTTGYKNSRITVYKYKCDYVYTEDYLPETPDRSFSIVIGPSGEIKQRISGR